VPTARPPSKTPPPPRKRRFWNYPRSQYTGLRRWLPSWKFVGACVLLGIAAVVGLFVWAYAATSLPPPAEQAFAQTTKVYYADGQHLMGEFSVQDRTIVPIEELPAYVGDAVVAAEDRTFWNNAGVDPVALGRAFYVNLRGGARQGGSTITQQYIERYYVGKTTTDMMGKFREAILAVKVTREKDKAEILSDYINTIYFGRGAYGIETAAEAYFGKHAKDLDVSQAALLAGVIPAPSNYDPAVDLEAAETRWRYVIDGMVKTGALTQAEHDSLVFPEVVEHEVSNVYGGVRGHLLQMVRSEMTTAGGLTENELDEGGLTIITTIDRDQQRAAVRAVRDLPKDRPDALQVAVVSVEPDTGGIRALYGGADYIERQQNAVTQDIAQAGSTFKPITLAAALATGEHSLEDWYSGRSPLELGDWKVENLGGTSYGNMTVLKATQNSVNTVYAQLNEEIGGPATRQTAIDLGIPADTVGLDDDLTNVLGTASPHPLDMANVYATLAAQGVRHTPHIVASAIDPDQRPVYTGPTEGERVLDADVAAEVTYALTQVVEWGTGTKARELERPCAAKTGTSEEHRSAWFVGYTPQMATAVAFYQEGPDGSVAELTPFGGQEEINGGALPAQIWVDLMKAEHKGLEVVDFPERPDDLGQSKGQWRGEVARSTAPEPSETESDDADPDPSPTRTPTHTPGNTPGHTAGQPETQAPVPPVNPPPVDDPATQPPAPPPEEPTPVLPPVPPAPPDTDPPTPGGPATQVTDIPTDRATPG
jgi:membrane peptidoglycan carboxypeptidase